MPLFAALDRLKTDLDALRPLAPEQEQRVLQKFRLEWNYNSNAIEGNSLTLGETKALLVHGVAASGKTIRDHDDIRNHNKVVAEVESLILDERPLTEHLIREMHATLMGKEPYYVSAKTAEGASTRQLIEPGNYKKTPNHAITATGEVLFFASPEETGAKMTDLVAWYRQETEFHKLHPVELATEFHHRFVRIHPFDDGNGRMSRLLMNLILLRQGFPMTIVKAIDRNRYLAALSSADTGEPEPFLRFIIENVEASLQLMIRAAKGESIDEPDDLDKKLALLKKQLASREEFKKSTWNAETQQSFFKDFFKFWVEDAWYTMRKLNELFFTVIMRLDIRDMNNRSFNDCQNVGLGELIGTIEETVMDTERMIGEIRLRFDWQDSRIVSIPFYQNIELLWKFEKYKYQTKFSLSPGSRLYQEEKKYGHYDLVHMKELNHQLASEAVDFIIAKASEADSSPS